MQMIDVLKRLAELDAANPNVDTGLRVVQPQRDISVAVTESTQVDECGMMPMGMEEIGRPSTPASINMTAGSGEELSDMIRAIATLAGTAKGGEEIVTGAPAQDTPQSPAAPQSSTDSMRSVIDKLNPADDEEGEQDDEETDEGLVGGALGGLAGAAMGGVPGAALGYAAGSKMGDDLGGDDKKESYDNTPNDPRDTNEFDAEQHAHHENPAGADRKGNANNPRAYDTNESIASRLMAEYQQFINEN